MAVSAYDIIGIAIGFLLVAVLTPIGMGTIVGTTTTLWNASVVTIFQVLLPILYLVGASLYFIPKWKK